MKTLRMHTPTLGLVAAGLTWPSLYGAVAALGRSPYERALESSFCGVAPHTHLLLAHCPTCWIGAAALFAATLVVAWRRQHAVAQRSALGGCAIWRT
jgi:hypothetical protein